MNDRTYNMNPSSSVGESPGLAAKRSILPAREAVCNSSFVCLVCLVLTASVIQTFREVKGGNSRDDLLMKAITVGAVGDTVGDRQLTVRRVCYTV